jgi:hypothetical protein
LEPGDRARWKSQFVRKEPLEKSLKRDSQRRPAPVTSPEAHSPDWRIVLFADSILAIHMEGGRAVSIASFHNPVTTGFSIPIGSDFQAFGRSVKRSGSLVDQSGSTIQLNKWVFGMLTGSRVGVLLERGGDVWRRSCWCLADDCSEVLLLPWFRLPAPESVP